MIRFDTEESHNSGVFKGNQVLRRFVGEDLSDVPHIFLDRVIGDITNVWSVDGYYSVPEDGFHVLRRQVREYRGRSNEDVVIQAKQEGLVRGVMVEYYLHPDFPIILGLSREEADRRIEENTQFLTKRTGEVYAHVKGIKGKGLFNN